MIRHFLYLSLTLCGLLLMSACGGQGKGHADESDSLSLDSAVYVGKDSTAADVSIHLEYFTGSSPLAVSVRQYATRQMESLSGMIYDGNNVSSEHENQSIARWDGDQDDVNGMANFYGKQIFENLLKWSQELNAGVGLEYALIMTINEELRLKCDADSFVTFCRTSYSYEGGAHGITLMETPTFVRSSGKLLSVVVDTLQLEAMQPLLAEGVCEYFKECGDTITTEELSDYLFSESFVNGMIPLPAVTLALTEEGVLFTYNQYEIAPYAAGIITFTIPYEKMQPFLTEQVKNLLKQDKTK